MEQQELETRHCRYCGKEIPSPRKRKDCDDRCKSQYHNKKNRDPSNPEVKAKKKFKKNYEALSSIVHKSGADSNAIPKKILLYEQYDFKVCTRVTHDPETNQPIFWTFDVGIQENPDGETFRLWFEEAGGQFITIP